MSAILIVSGECHMLLKRRMLWGFLVLLLFQTGIFAADNATARYFVVFLRRSPDRKPLTKEEGDRIQAAHMANIHKMAQDGVLVAAGPFEDTPPTISGIFVFKTDSLATAQRIAAQDPTVVEHRNTVDVHAWEGPARIGEEYSLLHKLHPKAPENMQVHPFCMLFHGPAWGSSTEQQSAWIEQHKQYVEQLKALGKLSAAGPVEDSADFVGLVIFRPIPDAEAKELMEADPAVKAGALRIEYHRWWSSDHVLPW
jgi:uncharacterized protein YciI